MEGVLDHCLDRREAGAACHENHGLVGILAQIEHAIRTFETQDLAPLVLVEELGAEISAWNVADVQIEQRIILRRSRDGEAASTPVAQQQIDVLPREVLQALVGWKLERDDRNVGGDFLDFLDAAGQLANLDIASA